MLFLQIGIAYTNNLSEATARKIMYNILKGDSCALRKVFLHTTISFNSKDENSLYESVAKIFAIPEVSAIPAVAAFTEEVTSATEFASALGYKLEASFSGEHSEITFHCVDIPEITHVCVKDLRRSLSD